MAIEAVRDFFAKYDKQNKVLEFEVSSATVELAAKALHIQGAQIAKSIALENPEYGVMLVVAAGDARVNNQKFKERFTFKPKFCGPDQTLQFTGHAIGGVCPFALAKKVPVYLDISLKRFEYVYPACGSSNSAIRLTIPELEEYSGALEWVDVCKIEKMTPINDN